VKIKLNKILLLLANVLFAASLTGYSQINDAGLWLSLGAEKKIKQALSVNYTAEFRLNENFTELGTIYNDFGLEYRFNKNLSIGAAYRFIAKKQPENYYSFRHRFYIDLNYKRTVGIVRLSGRLRLQNHYEDIFSSEQGWYPETLLRGRVGAKFNIPYPVKPYATVEVMTPLSGTELFTLEKIRYRAGLEYELNRMHSFDLFYMFQHDYGSRIPRNDFVVGMGYYFTF